RRGVPFLVYRDGTGGQLLVELGAGRERLTIGRRPSNGIALPWDAEVSRIHAALQRLGEDWVINDDGLSHNGTWINGQRVTGDRRHGQGHVARAVRALRHRGPAAERQARGPGDAGAAQRRSQQARPVSGTRVTESLDTLVTQASVRVTTTEAGLSPVGKSRTFA